MAGSGSRKIRVVVVLLMIAIGIGLAVLNRQAGDGSVSTESTGNVVSPNIVQPAEKIVQTEKALETLPKDASKDVPKDVKSDQPPSREALYQEVEKNPHGTPPSLINFAARLGTKLEAALASEPKAKVLFTELEDCVYQKAESTTPSVQALCLDNAKRLNAKYTSLSDRYQKLREKTDPAVVRLSELLD